MAVAVEPENVAEFVDQLLSAPRTEDDDIDMDELKTMITGKRKSFRSVDARKAGLEIGQRSNFGEIYANISQECRKSKQHNEETKDLWKQQKSEQRKQWKKAEKMIAEILQLKQEIANKHTEEQRLHSESSALQAQQQQQLNAVMLNDNDNDNAYEIEQLLTQEACVQRLDEQYSLLQSAVTETEAYEQTMHTQRSENNANSKELEALRKECHTYSDMMDASDDCRKLRPFQQCLQSMQRLLRVQTVTMEEQANGCLTVEYESTTKQIYVIQIRLQCTNANANVNGCSLPYDIQSVQITQGDTKYTEIADFVMRTLKAGQLSERETLSLPVVCPTVHVLLSKIVSILDRLPQRLADIERLFDLFGRQDIVPTFPENDQLVFRWKFKHGDAVTVTVPLVVTVGWQYPQPHGKDVITVQGHCCDLSEAANRELESQWNEEVEQIIQQVSGTFQSDIANFCNFIHDKLQQFADSQ